MDREVWRATAHGVAESDTTETNTVALTALRKGHCLENPLDRRAWWATVHGGHKQSDTTEKLTLHFIADSLCCTAEANTTL